MLPVRPVIQGFEASRTIRKYQFVMLAPGQAAENAVWETAAPRRSPKTREHSQDQISPLEKRVNAAQDWEHEEGRGENRADPRGYTAYPKTGNFSITFSFHATLGGLTLFRFFAGRKAPAQSRRHLSPFDFLIPVDAKSQSFASAGLLKFDP